MFRVRESLFGKSILQVSDGDEWNDAAPVESHKYGFNIVSVGHLEKLYARLAAAETRLHDYAEVVALARRRKKKLPVLVQMIPNLPCDFER